MIIVSLQALAESLARCEFKEMQKEAKAVDYSGFACNPTFFEERTFVQTLA